MGENCLFVPYVKVEVVEVVPFCFPFWCVSLNIKTDWGKVRVCKWGTAACNARFYKSLSCFNKQVRIFAVNGLWTAQLYSQYIYSHSNIIYIYIYVTSLYLLAVRWHLGCHHLGQWLPVTFIFLSHLCAGLIARTHAHHHTRHADLIEPPWWILSNNNADVTNKHWETCDLYRCLLDLYQSPFFSTAHARRASAWRFSE